MGICLATLGTYEIRQASLLILFDTLKSEQRGALAIWGVAC